MSKQLLPNGHPLAGRIPADVSPFDLAEQIVASRRGFSGPIGMSMKDPEDDPDEDEDDDEDDDDPLDQPVTIGPDKRPLTQREYNRHMSRAAKKAERTSQRALAKSLGFDTWDEALAAAKQSKGGGGDDDEAAQKVAEREQKAAERERTANEKARKADLRGALREAGATGDDLNDAYVILNAEIDEDYDEDDVAEAVEKLAGRRPALFGETDDGDQRPTPRAALPTGGKRKRPRQESVLGAGGLERARRKGWIKDKD